MRGRKPKPTRAKEREGHKGHRRLNRSEPEFAAPATLDPPAWLSDAAASEWRRVAPDLAGLGLLTRVDIAALAGYCAAYAHWVEAEAAIQAHGLTVTLRDDKGIVKSVQAIPQVAIALKMMDKVRAFAAEFGLTPSSRGRIELEKAQRGAGSLDELSEAELLAEYERLKAELGRATGSDTEATVQ